MNITDRQEKALLLKTARAIACALYNVSQGTAIRIYIPKHVHSTFTGGWLAKLGRFGKKGIRIEVWLDRFTKNKQRKFYFVFNSDNKRAFRTFIQGLDKNLRPRRTFTNKNIDDDEIFALSTELKRKDFLKPIYEKYDNGWEFLGEYDPSTRRNSLEINRELCDRAVTFFDNVARSQENVKDPNSAIYPKTENRLIVRQHVQRERNSNLARQRKLKDKFKCKICGMQFEKRYGEVGRYYAEAHHHPPLSNFKGKVTTGINDLVTVCSNCHKMLHKMDGKKSDLEALKKKVQYLARKQKQ